jgi:hypothetical protein
VGPDQPIISIEQNPRGHANRFTRQDGPHNGAGKPLQVQMDEIRAMLDCYEGPVDVALVEDFVNTGRGIAERFGGLMDDPAIRTTIITGLVNDRARQLLEGRAAIAATTTTEPGTNVHHMDVSDLLPTLGGRVVGWSRRTPAGPTAPVLRAVGGIARQVPMAVDAICGNYPWQADIYRRDTDSAFMRRLGSFCATSALEFWESLEQAADRELTWDVLHRLTGTLRIFYPVKDLAAHHLPAHMIQPSPRRAVEAIIQEAAHA